MKHLMTMLFGALLLVGATACERSPESVQALERVAEQPRDVAGEVLTVTGRIHRVLGDCAFEVEDADLLSPDRVLTLCAPAGPAETPASVPDGLDEGDWLRLTGVAGEMTRENYEFKSTLTLPDDVFGERETRPVVLIEGIEKIDPPTQ